jgi:phage terminase large subunit
LIHVRAQAPAVFEPLLAPARYKGAWGGRGSAKSHFFAGLLVARACSEKIDAVCVREVQKSLAQSVKKLLEIKIEALGVSNLFAIKEDFIGTPYGGRFIFQGMQNHTADTIKSLEGYDVAWVEEAQSLSQRSLDLLRPTIRKPESELWFSWNPNNPTDPVDALLRGESPPPDSVVVKSTYRDNPWLPDVLKQELEYDQRRDPDKFAHVWLGGYQRNSEARVFKNWKVEEFTAPMDAVFRLGADWGFANDPSVLVRCYLMGRKLFVDYEAHMIGCEINQLPDLFDRIPESRKYFITADSARPETISYMRKHGYPKINAAVKGARSLEEGIEFLKSFDIIVHPRCQHVIDELTLYCYETDKLTGQILPKPEDKHNHMIDALRYACEGVRKAVRVPANAPRVAESDYAYFS